MIVPRIKLSELCHVVTKGTTPTSIGYDFSEEGIPFLRIQNLGNSSVSLDDVLYIDRETHAALKRSVIKPKDFLITIAGTIGRVAIVPDDFPECNCNQAIAILRFDNEKLWPIYLLYWLTTQDAISQIAGKKVTATISNLSLGQIKELEIPLPPLAEQKRIAAILDKADAIRRKRQQAIKLADEFLRSVFLDMFGDPVTNPKGWEVKLLKDMAVITTGNTPSRDVPEYYGDFIEWIKSDNINTPNHVLTKATEYLSIEGYKVSRSVPAGSTLVTCIAGSFDCIGNAAYTDREVTFNQQINALTPKEITNCWFLYALVILSKKIIQSASTNSMKGMISKGRMEGIQLICPPVDIQNKFQEIFLRYQASQNTVKKSELNLQNIFNSLSQKAFSGSL